MNKAQIETIGLLVIIILLVLLATIFITFYLRASPEIEVKESAKLSNFLNTISKISFNSKKLSDLVYDCYISSDCNLLQQELTSLTSSFFKQNFSYSFKTDKEFFSFGTCTLGLASNYQFIKNNLNFIITLKLC